MLTIQQVEAIELKLKKMQSQSEELSARLFIVAMAICFAVLGLPMLFGQIINQLLEQLPILEWIAAIFSVGFTLLLIVGLPGVTRWQRVKFMTNVLTQIKALNLRYTSFQRLYYRLPNWLIGFVSLLWVAIGLAYFTASAIVVLPTMLLSFTLLATPWLSHRLALWAIDKPLQQNQPDLALRRTQRLHRLLRHPRYLYWEAIIHLYMGDFYNCKRLCLSTLETPARLRPDELSGLLQLLGWAYDLSGHSKQAQQTLTSILMANPIAAINLAENYLRQENFAVAIRLCQFVLQNLGAFPAYHHVHARALQTRAYLEQSNPFEAEVCLRAGEALLPSLGSHYTSAQAYYHLGLAWRDFHNPQKARAHLGQAIALTPKLLMGQLAKQALETL